MMDYGHIGQEDLALYAMQLLSEDEAATVTAHLETCAACRREVAELQGDLAAFAMTAEMQSPPAAVKQRLMKQVAREKKVIPLPAPVVMPAPIAINGPRERSGAGYGNGYSENAPEEMQPSVVGSHRRSTAPALEDEQRGSRSFAAKALPWLGWALAASVTVAAGTLYRDRAAMQREMVSDKARIDSLAIEAARGQAILDTLTDQGATRVTLTPNAEKARPQGRATYVPEKGSLVFLASNLEPLRPYKTYELWLIPADGTDPIPAGTFRPDARGNASVILPEVPKGKIAKAFGVTIEDDGGSKTPTMPIVLSGA